MPRVLASLATDFLPFLKERPWRLPSVPIVLPETAAVGSIVLALAVFAMVRARSADAWVLAGLAVFGLLMRAGWIPLARIMQKVPLFDIAFNERLAFAASFAIACLAAIGAQAILSRARDRSAAITFTVMLAVLAAGTVWILRTGWVAPSFERYGDFKIAAEIGCLSLAALLLVTRLPRSTVIPVLLGLILVQRTASEAGVYPLLRNEAAYPPLALLEPLKSTPGPFRTIGAWANLMPGSGAFYELEDVRGYQAMTNLRYFETLPLWCRRVPVFFNHVDDLTDPFLSFLNVRFAIATRGYPAPDGWRVVAADRGATLLENTRVLPRAFIPSTVEVGVFASETLDAMRDVTDFRAKAWLQMPGTDRHERTNGPGTVKVERAPNGYNLEAEMQGDGWIVVSTVAWPGWRAYVDGRRVRIHIANHAFLSVFVPRGTHKIRMTYLPETFVIGKWISFATLAGVLAWALTRRVRRTTPR